jgi:hypothetical protein
MKNGSSFLWFDRASNVPKFARFKMEFNENLNAVHLSIRRKGDENATIINATNLISISRGQTSKIFNKKRLSAPRRLALISFTLTYDKRTKAQLQDSKSTVDTATIDVIAKDAMEFEIWTEGLETLISHYHNAYGCAEFMRQVVAKQCILISLPQGMKKQESYILDLVVSCPWTLVEMGYKSAATTDTKRSKKGGNLEERRGSFTVLSNIKRRFSSSSRSSRRNSTQSTTSVEDSEETSSSAVSAAASLQDNLPMRYFSNEGSFGDDGTSSEEDEAKFIQARVVRSLSRSSVDAPYVSTGSPLTRNSWMQESTTPTSALHTALISSPSLSNSPITSIIMTPALDPSEMRDMKIIPAPQNTPMSLSKIRRQQQLFMPLSSLLTVSPKKGKWVYGMFSLTRDQFYLTWVLPSDKKHKVEQRIKLSGIDRVVFGQTTKTFTKHKCPRELAEVSFTIIYDKNRQMDLIAPSTTAFEMWTEVLTKLSKQTSSTSMLHSVSIPQVEIPDMTRTTVINAFGAFDKDQFKLKNNEQQ